MWWRKAARPYAVMSKGRKAIGDQSKARPGVARTGVTRPKVKAKGHKSKGR